MSKRKLQRNRALEIIENSQPKRSRSIRKESILANEELVVVEKGIKEGGCVLVCGDGVAGQLGLGEDVSEKLRPSLVEGLTDIVDVVAGGMHSICVTKSRTRLITFGCNDEGALGRDTSEPGTEFDPGPVDLPGPVAQVSAGDSHTAVLLADGSVYVWGVFRDSRGPMGLISREIEKIPKKLEMKTKVCQIASGSNHLVMLGVSGQVYTMGCGEQGQLGRVTVRAADRDCRHGIDPLLTPSLVNINVRKRIICSDIWAGAYCTYIKEKSSERIYAFGLNNYKQLGLGRDTIFWPLEAKNFNGVGCEKISVGEHHAVALSRSGKVYVIGRKEYGRLGLGAGCEDAEEPTKVVKLDQEQCTDVACGSVSTFSLSSSGKVYSWGMSSSQLGHGSDDADLEEPTPMVGKTLDKYTPLRISAGGQHLLILAKPK